MEYDYGAIHYTALTNNTDVIQFLINSGDEVDRGDNMALEIAGHYEAFNLLMDAGYIPYDSELDTYYFAEAIIGGNVEIIKEMMLKKYEINYDSYVKRLLGDCKNPEIMQLFKDYI